MAKISALAAAWKNELYSQDTTCYTTHMKALSLYIIYTTQKFRTSINQCEFYPAEITVCLFNTTIAFAAIIMRVQCLSNTLGLIRLNNKSLHLNIWIYTTQTFMDLPNVPKATEKGPQNGANVCNINNLFVHIIITIPFISFRQIVKDTCVNKKSD